MRAFFSEGVDKMRIPWAVETLPTLLHLSLFLFFGGLVAFLFNVDKRVFSSVIWWIGIFSMMYGMITLFPIFRHDSPYNAPISPYAWLLFACIRYVIFTVLTSITCGRYPSYRTWRHFQDHGWMFGGVEKVAEKTVSIRSPEIDARILDWTISALGDDDSLENFFEAIPGFFNSELVRLDLHPDLRQKLGDALYGFLDRTLSSKSVIDSVKLHRLDISLNAMCSIRVSSVLFILNKVLVGYWDQVPQTIEMGTTLAPWCNNDNEEFARSARGIVTKVLATVQERDGSWVSLAGRMLGLSERDLRNIIAHGSDSVLLAILIQVTRQYIRFNYVVEDVFNTLPRFDIRSTPQHQQHDFCSLWNELVQEAGNQRRYLTLVPILRLIRHYYIALHQSTDAAPTAFSASTHSLNSILFQSSSYPSCDIAGHHPDSTIYTPAHDSSTIPRQAEQANSDIGPRSPSNPTTTSEIGEASLAPITMQPTNSAHSSPSPTDASPVVGATAAPQDIALTAKTSHPLGGSRQQVVVAPSAEPDTSQIVSTVSAPAPTATSAPVPASPRPVLKMSSASYGAGVTSATSASDSILPTSSCFSNPVSPPPPRDPPLPNAEFLALLNSTTPFHPTSNATLTCLRTRGLVNRGNRCFANAVLQLLVHSLPFWNLFKELGDLKGQRGAGIPETGGATPLIGATMRFFEEFMLKEKEPPTQQAAGGRLREDDEKKELNAVDAFEPTYLYDAMKEKRQLRGLLVRSFAASRPPFTDLCRHNVFRMASSRMRKSFSVSI